MSGENKGAVPGAIHEADTAEMRRPGATALGQTCVERCPDYPRCSHASAPLPDRGVHAPCSPDTACQACAKGNIQATWPGSLPPFVIMKLEGLGYTIESHDDQRDGTWTMIYWDRSPGGWYP